MFHLEKMPVYMGYDSAGDAVSSGDPEVIRRIAEQMRTHEIATLSEWEWWQSELQQGHGDYLLDDVSLWHGQE